MVLPNVLKHTAIDLPAADSNQGLYRALVDLWRADECARTEQCNPWEFAVEMDRLLAAGLTTSDLRWLVKKGFVEHAYEVTRRNDQARRFKSCCNVSFEPRTCFLLTKSGALLAAAQGLRLPPTDGIAERRLGIRGAADGEPGASNAQSAAAKAPPACVPSWDPSRRELYWNGQLVKQFKVPSPTQEAVLAAFEEEGWPTAVDDPLPPVPDQDSKRRLRSTIQHLNAHQTNRLLNFRGDGSGQRIIWQAIDSAQAPPVAGRLTIHAA